MKTCLSFCLFLLLSLPHLISQYQADIPSKIDELMQKMHHNGHFNGTVLVAEKGKIIYKTALGYANFKSKRKLKTNSLFYLASVSKQFTTMGIMLLAEKGKLTYQDALSKYFPEFPDYADKVTLQHLMTHTSGIPDHYRLGIYKPGLTNEDVFQKLILQKELDFEPGEKYQYSNGGFVLLAMIIEKVSGQSLPEFMDQNIFSPLKMKSSLVFHPKTPEIKDRALGHTAFEELDDYEIFTTGAGGLYSTIGDLFKWDRALHSNKLVKPKTLEEAFTGFVLNDGSTSNYGYGWGIAENETAGKVVRHSGGLNGFRTFIERDIQNQRVIIVLTNNSSQYLSDVMTALRKVLSGQPIPILPKISISGKIYKVIESDGIEKGLASYNKIKTTQPKEYDFAENQLNDLGYMYMSRKDFSKAIAIFQQNMKSYPDGFNVYGSLGEAYLKNGDTEKAIENYKKSLQLNPGNENAKIMLGLMGVDPKKIEKAIEISKEILDTYVGNYEYQPGGTIAVTREENQLKVQLTGKPKFDISPMAENKFYLKAIDAQITFHTSDKGAVDRLTLFLNGREMVCPRLKE